MLHFYYGLMNSGKSNLLTIMYYSCRDNNKSVYVCKSRYDTRTSNTISTRVAIPGLKVDMLIDDQLDLDTVPGTKYDVILIDEVQFLTLPQIETLRRWAEIRDVYCFGLLTTWQTDLFPASKRLVELADNLSKVIHIANKCTSCNNPAILHKKTAGTSNIVEIGNDIYSWKCWTCYIGSNQ